MVTQTRKRRFAVQKASNVLFRGTLSRERTEIIKQLDLLRDDPRKFKKKRRR